MSLTSHRRCRATALIDALRFQLSQLRRMRFGLSSDERSVQIEQVDGKAAVAAARKDPRVAKPNGQRRSAAFRHIFCAPSSGSNRT
jgi:Transposase C of IS166 homeodomain